MDVRLGKLLGRACRMTLVPVRALCPSPLSLLLTRSEACELSRMFARSRLTSQRLAHQPLERGQRFAWWWRFAWRWWFAWRWRFVWWSRLAWQCGRLATVGRVVGLDGWH